MIQKDKIIYLTVFLFLAFTVVGFVLFTEGRGYDYKVYCTAVDRYYHSTEDPYDPLIISKYTNGIAMPYTYPPVTLHFFGILCTNSMVNPTLSYYQVYTLLILASMFIIYKTTGTRESFHYAFILILSAFLAIVWTFSTGNVGGIFFLLMISIVYYFYVDKRYNWSAFFVGLMSSVHIFPIVFSLLFTFVDRPLKERVRLITISIITMISTLMISFIVDAKYFMLYIQGITGQTSPLLERGGLYTPTLYQFIKDIVNDIYGYYFFSALLIMTIAIFVYEYYKNNKDVDVFSYGIIALFLLIPRLKPYYFTVIIVPLYFLLKDRDYKIKYISLGVVSIFPIICLLLYESIPNPIFLYGDSLCALGIFIYISFLSFPNQHS